MAGFLASCSTTYAQPFIPGGVDSVGLSYTVPDMPVWYSRLQLPGQPFPGYVTNGPVDVAAQVSVTEKQNGNWEPYTSVVGDSTFLIGAGMFADDGTFITPQNVRPNQRYIVTLQPASGGSPKIGEVFYDDFGKPYRLHTMMRQRNPGVRVAGDKRAGATNFLAGGTAALLYGKFWYGIDYFNTDGRYNTSYPLYGTGFGSLNNEDGAGNPAGTTDYQAVSVQAFSLNPTTLAQTPLCKALDPFYALSWRDHVPVELCNNAGLACGDGGAKSDNVSYFGGDMVGLDNGNFVVVANDYTGFLGGNVASAATVAMILRPDGSVLKDTWLVDPREIWANVAAYKGGFCARVQDKFYFYDNAGTLTASNTVASSGVGFDTGRGDGTRIGSDIRSHYVYLAGPVVPPEGGKACGLGIWDARTGAFVTNVVVSSDLDASVASVDRVGVAVDASERVCVAFAGVPDTTAATAFQLQIIARVMKFDGKNVTYMTPSFFPFMNADTNVDNVLGFKTTNPSVAMTSDHICIAAKSLINSQNDPTMGPDTSAETTVYTVIPTPFLPGSIESVGLTRVVADTPIVKTTANALGNWEPYSSVLGASTFLVEGNTFADDGTDLNQRAVVALQPVAGGAMKLGEGFYADNGQPFKGQINLSRQNGNPGRVAGDTRPGAVNFMVGLEASPHGITEFQGDNRWNLGFDRLSDGRYGTIQIYKLDTATLVQTPLCKAQDSAYGRLTAGTAAGNQVSRFGGDMVCLDNGNFVSVVEDRSRVIVTDSDCVVATIFAPDGSIVKDSWVVVNGDIWSNVAPCKGGFAVRAKPADGSATRLIYFYDNAGTLKGSVDQATSGASFDAGRGDGTRIFGHINSPFVYLTGKVTDAPNVKVVAFDSRTQAFAGITDVNEGAFTGGFDRAFGAVDALDRLTVSWVSQPAGYVKQQVAARILKFDGTTKAFIPLTKSFFPFVNNATNDIRTLQMSVAMTTKQICVAAKGEINYSNKPELGPDSPTEVNFYTVFTHPAPAEDPTTPAGGQVSAKLSVAVSGSNVVISWNAAATGYTLESKSNLSDASWTTVGTANPSTVAIGTGSKFFRLRK